MDQDHIVVGRDKGPLSSPPHFTLFSYYPNNGRDPDLADRPNTMVHFITLHNLTRTAHLPLPYLYGIRGKYNFENKLVHMEESLSPPNLQVWIALWHDKSNLGISGYGALCGAVRKRQPPGEREVSGYGAEGIYIVNSCELFRTHDLYDAFFLSFFLTRQNKKKTKYSGTYSKPWNGYQLYHHQLQPGSPSPCLTFFHPLAEGGGEENR